ncbi:DUF4198 domain-containing protein [Massilia sp. YIM B02769]|uniref:DUF4198 domain-containing protein n=1 Tax=Massilia sp. YIM B02769 TaxID=3050129 RepID=UPI0025B69BA5|nr:DUF4198 domain-containing protein [Massilia sp. YIM B02769]MDN4058886.1 DUF4198 domain-containing protein [Massilia sp. YIM B02769]
MQTNLIKHGVLALILTATAGAASAHRPWMVPTSTMVESKNAWVTVDGAISEGLFDVDHMPLRMNGLSVTAPDGTTSPAPEAVMGKMRTSVDIPLPQDGTYRIALVSTNVFGSYKDGNEVKRFRGSEADFNKQLPAGATEVKKTITNQRIETFVSANKTSDGALKPTNAGIEMIPLSNPNDLRSGETLRVRFLLDGKPLPKLAFSMVPGGVRYRGVLGEVRLTTDDKGEASIKLPAPNMYWVNAVYPPAPGKGAPPSDAPETRRFAYTGSLEILPE